MNVQTNIPLKDFTTMRLGGNARFLAEATSLDDLKSLYQNAAKTNMPVFIIGGGSNLIVHDEGFNGLVIVNRIPGFEVIAEDDDSTTIKVGAGETWDSVVERAVDMNLSGIEALSAIPGTAGAAPVQNIGAYGQEVADTLQYVEAYDTKTDSFVRLDASDCEFSYRHSIFRGSEQGRYAITAIVLRLVKTAPQPPFYDSLQKYMDENNITDYTPASIRQAVIAIRRDKLPDPSVVANSGSFFKNAVIEAWQAKELEEAYPGIPIYKMDDDHFKVATGWLIDQANFKGEVLHGMRVHTGNALVLINESATGYADLEAARTEIINTVRDKFRITIQQEPLEMPVV
jgi:UDP-N-acetylmuramate dehydrogenase